MAEPDVVRVRFWAAARAAAGCAEQEVVVPGVVSLADLTALLVASDPDGSLPRVLAICSVLVGDRPVSSQDPGAVVVRPGDVVEFLPPFAGG